MPGIPSTVYGKVIRLHVLANSDSEHDQMLKLAVRDGLLEVTQELFCDCTDVTQALETAKGNVRLLEQTAKQVLEQNGSTDSVKIVVGKETYPKKRYGNYIFPEGEYLSVRVLIGNGAGQNWWCVLFPPLCSAGIEDGGKVMESCGFSDDEIRRLESKSGGVEIFGCRVKLKLLDFLTEAGERCGKI